MISRAWKQTLQPATEHNAGQRLGHGLESLNAVHSASFATTWYKAWVLSGCSARTSRGIGSRAWTAPPRFRAR